MQPYGSLREPQPVVYKVTTKHDKVWLRLLSLLVSAFGIFLGVFFLRDECFRKSNVGAVTLPITLFFFSGLLIILSSFKSARQAASVERQGEEKEEEKISCCESCCAFSLVLVIWLFLVFFGVVLFKSSCASDNLFLFYGSLGVWIYIILLIFESAHDEYATHFIVAPSVTHVIVAPSAGSQKDTILFV